MQFRVNPDKQHVEEIRAAIRANGGYCPCQLEKSDATKCICKNFLENVKAGSYCHCGLYKKVED